MRRCFYHKDLRQNAVFHNFSRQIALIQYLEEGANGGIQFSVNYYVFGQISVNYHFFGQFSVNCYFWLAINFHFPTANIIPS